MINNVVDKYNTYIRLPFLPKEDETFCEFWRFNNLDCLIVGKEKDVRRGKNQHHLENNEKCGYKIRR